MNNFIKTAAFLTLGLAACDADDPSTPLIDKADQYCGYEVDLDNDGYIERRGRVTRNENGLALSEVIDYFEDEQLSRSEQYTMDYEGDHPLPVHYAHFVDDELISETETNYNSEGLIVDNTVLDSNASILSQETYEYENSLLVRNEYYSLKENEAGAKELTLDRDTTWDHKDNSGKVFDETRYESNLEGFRFLSSQTRVSEYVYRNIEVLYILDENYPANLPNDLELKTYNAAGQLIELKEDLGADGEFDYITRYSYNAEGQVLQYSIERDGEFLIDRTYERDENGSLTRILSVGSFPYTTTLQYNCDDSP